MGHDNQMGLETDVILGVDGDENMGFEQQDQIDIQTSKNGQDAGILGGAHLEL